MKVLQLTNLKKTFNRTEMITNVNYIFDKGGIYPIIGRHGSGKTLLCECIAGLCKPDSGKVYISNNGKAMLVHEEPEFPPYLTVMEYLSYICDRETAARACERTGVPVVMFDRLISSCDHETRKRLQLAVVLIKSPYVMAFDALLDYCSDAFFDDVLSIFDEIRDDHIIIVTSGSIEVAKELSEDLVVLNNGELNMVSGDSFAIPEIRQAVIELLDEGEDDEIN